MPSRQLTNILNQLKGVKGKGNLFTALCPSHNDKRNSLTIKEDDRGVAIHCFAGCSIESICSALNLEVSDLFINNLTSAPSKKIIAEYSYYDEDGKELFQVVRYEPKSFAQRHKNSNNQWVWTGDTRKVLYHLPEILIEMDKIYFVEGEKDADKLWQYGQVATTSPGGVNAWKPEFASPLIGKPVVIIPDNDPAGMAYARQVAKALQNQAQSLACVILSDAKDISEWLEKDNDIADLPPMEQNISALFTAEAPQYRREGNVISWHKDDYIYEAQNIHQERTGVHARVSISQEYQPLAWTIANIDKSDERVRLANQVKKNDESIRQSLDLFCAGLWDYSISTDTPELMIGEDTAPPSFYLYPYILQAGGTILFSPPGRGKSFSALLWAQSINAGVSTLWQVQKQPVLYINLERSTQSLKRRLAAVNRVLGLEPTHPLLIYNKRGQPLSALAPNITKAIEQNGIKLIILDSISRAGYGDLTENRPVNLIIDTLSNLCPSWLALGHTPRADESHIFGGIMFEAGADIVIQLTSEPEANKLGIKYEIVKANDLPATDAQTFSLEFEEWNLKSVAKAMPFEFAELATKRKPKMLPAILDFILNRDTADASATMIADELNFDRANVSALLNKSGKFVKTRAEGRSQFYGVKEKG